jgi:hypothetical protein
LLKGRNVQRLSLFLGGEYGSTGEPDAFAATLRTVLAGQAG